MLWDLCLATTFGLSLTTPALAQTFDWSTAYTKANASLAKLSLQDKVNIVTGVGWDKGPCVGNTLAISSINYPQLCLQDSPLGIRFGKGSTAFTPGIQAASTWDIDLIRQRGQFMGAEAKGAGVHVQLGPVAGPLGKIAQGGRNWEGFGPDPYLTGICMAETIQGMQGSGVQATAKVSGLGVFSFTFRETGLFAPARTVPSSIASSSLGSLWQSGETGCALATWGYPPLSPPHTPAFLLWYSNS